MQSSDQYKLVLSTHQLPSSNPNLKVQGSSEAILVPEGTLAISGTLLQHYLEAIGESQPSGDKLKFVCHSWYSRPHKSWYFLVPICTFIEFFKVDLLFPINTLNIRTLVQR